MAATYHINDEDEFVSFTFGAHVDLVDLYELLQALLRDPTFDPSWPQLMDLRNIELDLKSEALKPFVRFLNHTYRCQVEGAIAVVLDDDMSADLCAGVYRLACSLSDTEVFDDYALAIKWLLQQNWQTPGYVSAH